jgi:hypothetical protein
MTPQPLGKGLLQTRGRRVHRAVRAAAAGVAMLGGLTGTALADIVLPPVTIGAGIQTSFYNCDKACIYSPGTVNSQAGDTTVSGFALNSVRLYVNGTVTDNIKIMFNTEYDGSGAGENKVGILDAVGRFEFSDHLNIWAGRFLPPSDRANLYGPYYADDWTPFADGVADLYPSIFQGRDNGVAYWGQFGIAKLSVGVFDGQSLNSAVNDTSKLLYAARAQFDFWDPEAGYYLNGTYYGEKDLLALGLAAQNQDSKTLVSVDGLMEKKLPDSSVVTVEAEYEHDNGLSSTNTSKGWYGLGAYLFPQQVGIGKIQVLAKYSQKTINETLVADAAAATAAEAEEVAAGDLKAAVNLQAQIKAVGVATASDKLKTTEVDINYVIKSFNARVGLYYLHQKDDLADFSPHEIGLKLQLQM